MPFQGVQPLGELTSNGDGLYGPVQDQAALYGLLDRIQSLGLELVEIRQLPASAEVPAEPEHPPDR
jgi:hypothetical protein